MFGWLFQGFQERVRRPDCHSIGVVDQADLSFGHERAVHDLMLDLADLLDLDLPAGLFWIRLDDDEVRMSMGFDLPAGAAGATTVEAIRIGRVFATERLRESGGRQSFSDRLLAMEQIGVG